MRDASTVISLSANEQTDSEFTQHNVGNISMGIMVSVRSVLSRFFLGQAEHDSLWHSCWKFVHDIRDGNTKEQNMACEKAPHTSHNYSFIHDMVM
jgi:hypothetical protein